MLIDKEKSALVIIDAQESLVPVVAEPRRVIDGCSALARAGQLLHIPAIVTEQYPKGLGQTIFDVRQYLNDATFVEKKEFSAFKNPAFREKIASLKRQQIILCGVEFHICVFQTAVDLKLAGYDPFIVVNACSSRYDIDFQTAKERLTAEGIALVTREMVLYEWLETSASPDFKTFHTHLLR